MKCPKCKKNSLVKTKGPVFHDNVEKMLFFALFIIGVAPGLMYFLIKALVRKDIYTCLECSYTKQV